MTKVAIITNIPAPYSTDLYNQMLELDETIELNIIYSAMSRSNRKWTIKSQRVKNIYSLDSFIISKKYGEYMRYIHIPKGTWRTLSKVNPEILLVYEYSIAS